MTSRSTAGVLMAVGLLAATSPAVAQRGPAPRVRQSQPRSAVAGLRADARRSSRRRCRCASPVARTRSSAASTRRRPGHDQRRHEQRHRGRPGVLRRAACSRPPRADHRATRRRRSARPAGSRSTRWTTRCRWRRSRTRATRSRSTTTSSRSSCPSSRPSRRTVRSRSATTTARCWSAPIAARSFGKGDYFVVDRGSDHGVEVGSQFVLYRDKKQAENFLFEIGEAVAVEVKAEMSTLQVTRVARRDSSQATTSR